MKTKTLSFIVPYIGVPIEDLQINGLISAYIGDQDMEPEVWGERLYLLFLGDLLKPFMIETLRNRKDFHTMRSTAKGILMSFTFTDDFKLRVVKPFLMGKYSQIDRDYVKNHFQKHRFDGRKFIKSNNYCILHKDPDYKAAWEERLGTSLPDDAEVGSRPIKEKEVFAYPKQTDPYEEKLKKILSNEKVGS